MAITCNEKNGDKKKQGKSAKKQRDGNFMTEEELAILREILAQLKEANRHLDKIENQAFGY